MVLSHMGVRRNWWSSIACSPVTVADVENMPIGEAPQDTEEAEEVSEGTPVEAADVDGPGKAGVSAAKARKVVQETRDDSEGTLHYIASMLMKPQNMELCTGMTQISTAFRATFYKNRAGLLHQVGQQGNHGGHCHAWPVVHHNI